MLPSVILNFMEPQLFIITQNAVLKNSSGAVLIIRHTTGKWLLPGGKINTGETWIAGLKRELHEELGISDFQIKNILDVDSWIEGGQGHCAITYLIESPSKIVIELSHEHNEYAWVQLKDLDKYDFWHQQISQRIRKAYR